MNGKNTFKTAFSAFVFSAAMAGGVAYAEQDSSDQSDMLQMKSDANVENRSADKAAVFNYDEEQSETTANEYDSMDSEQQYDTESYSQDTSQDWNTENAEQDQYQASSQMSEQSDMDNTLHFQFDSTELTSEGQEKLESIKEQLSQNPNSRANVELVGYTDTSGPEVYNQYLSEERAKAIRSELEGSNVEITEVEGRGEENPIADNDSREGRQENRRVEVNISFEGDAVSSAEQF